MTLYNRIKLSGVRTGIAAFVTVAILFTAGCSSSGGGDDGVSETLEYVGKVCEPSTQVDFMDVSYDGLVFTLGGYTSIDNCLYVHTTGGEDRGTFRDDADEEIRATMFFIDKSNLVNIIHAGLGTTNIWYRYRTDGTLYDQMSLTSAPAVPLTSDGIVLLGNGTIAIGCMRTNVIDSLDLYVINFDLGIEYQLSGEDLVGMIPGFADAGAGTANGVFNGMGTGGNSEIYLTVEFQEGDNDGILVLNSDLTKKRYVGRDWDFNCPFDIATDGNGYHYVSNMSCDNLKVLDDSWSFVARSAPDDSDSSVLNQPGAVCVRGDYVYVYSWDSPVAIQRFKTFRDCPDETAADDPEQFGGGGAAENNDPVISDVSLVANHDYDVDLNYMGGTFTYTATAHDPDGDDITYSWELVEYGVPGHATLSPSGASAIVIADSFGSGYLVLTVTDEHGAEATWNCDTYGPPI